jgi:hypothetical protein
MIKQQVSGDIFKASCRHIVFAVNVEGRNDEGFAGQVSDIYPELAHTGGNRMGEIITLGRKDQEKIFHAIVCHSLSAYPGWSRAPEIIEDCLNWLDIPDDEPIAVVLMGGGAIGKEMGADVQANLAAMERSKKTVIVYSR